MSYGVVRHINHYNGGDHWDVSTRSVGDGPSHLVTPLSYEFYCTPTPGTPNRLSVSGPAGLDATVCATARSGDRDAVRSGDDAPPDAPPARVCPGLYMSPCITDGDTGGAAGEAGCLSTGLCFDWAQVDSWPASWYTPRANMPEAEPEQAGAAADAIVSGH